MRWVRYQERGTDGNEAAQYGRLDGATISQISGLPWGEHVLTGHTVPLAGVRLLPPVIPPTFYAAGVNYWEHLRGAAKRAGKELVHPDHSDIGYRAINALIGDGDFIVVPSDSSGKLQYEGELVVVIGKRARNLSEQEAMSCVFGYTIGNDVSERVWQRSDRTLWRGKNCDTFKPMGPWIETDVDLDTMMTTVHVNGKQMSRFRTNDMVFGIATTIATITRYITLVPGDIIWMGTDDPVADMVAGDKVTISITGIGELTNTLVAE